MPNSFNVRCRYAKLESTKFNFVEQSYETILLLMTEMGVNEGLNLYGPNYWYSQLYV